STLLVTVVYVVGRVLIKRFAITVTMEARLRQALVLVTVGGLILFWYLHPARTYVADIAHHTVLPVVTLGLVPFGETMLLTRSASLETWGRHPCLPARATGRPARGVRHRHAARNARLPVTTSLVLRRAFAIGGGIVTESVFSWPGTGQLLLQAVMVSDIPL